MITRGATSARPLHSRMNNEHASAIKGQLATYIKERIKMIHVMDKFLARVMDCSLWKCRFTCNGTPRSFFLY